MIEEFPPDCLEQAEPLPQAEQELLDLEDWRTPHNYNVSARSASKVSCAALS